MRRRAVSATRLVGVVLVMGCGSLGCTPDRSAGVGWQLIDGVRSDPDDRGLVVSYTGGACDGPARLVLRERATRVEAEVVVKESAGSCTSLGIARTVGARLAEPIGQRTVWVGGRQHVPFDGAGLLTPSVLPPDFVRVSEMGISTEAAATPTGSVVTTTWVTTRSEARPASTGDECPSTRGSIEVRIGPTSVDESRGRTRVGPVKVGTARARLYRDRSGGEPVGWAYAWTVDHQSVVVSTGTDCDGDRPLSRTELLEVAESLQPA